jgi:hypothetical protein
VTGELREVWDFEKQCCYSEPEGQSVSIGWKSQKPAAPEPLLDSGIRILGKGPGSGLFMT